MSLLVSAFQSIGHSVASNLPGIVILAIAFTVLSLVAKPANPGRPWYRKPDLIVDLCYWFIVPMIGSLVFISLLSAAMMVVQGIDPQAARDYVTTGRGPLSGLGFWPQVVIALLASDFLLYWSHRFYHTATLWRFHAIHHSSEHLEWISATRFHPGNILLGMPLASLVLILMGISADALVAINPFNLVTGALVHANLNWSFGRFGILFASPIFHRWHHTAADRGGSKNFASTFPFLDAMFGTYYMPAGETPDHYGVDDEAFPSDLLGQMMYPWRKPRPQTGPLEAAPDPAHQPATADQGSMAART